MFHRLMIVVALVGCAAGTEQEPDAGVSPDNGPHQPPSASECAEGQHACGSVCFVRQPNEPENGCAFGCGVACPTPQQGVATCTDDGRCDVACDNGLMRVGDTCMAATCQMGGYSCGTAADGSSCGYCVSGIQCGDELRCDIPDDSMEWNNSWFNATPLANLDDSDDPDVWVDDLSIGNVAGATTADEDWFTFYVTDGFDGGSPAISIELATHESALGWLQSTHELFVYFRCENGDPDATVSCGEWYTQYTENSELQVGPGVGCKVSGQYILWATISTGCFGTNDGGWVTIHVRKQTPPRGDLYDLHINVQ